jgi:hypothetical protein
MTIMPFSVTSIIIKGKLAPRKQNTQPFFFVYKHLPYLKPDTFHFSIPPLLSFMHYWKHLSKPFLLARNIGNYKSAMAKDNLRG